MFSQKEIKKIIAKGETSQIEFKSEREKNVDFAKEITAFANGMGGYLIVGVEDNGEISGIANPSKFEERIYNICSDSTRPVAIPQLWRYKINRKDVFCFSISAGFSKPYAILQRNKERYYVRRGTRTQEATRDELLRLFQTSGQVHYEINPVIKGRYKDLDILRINSFFNYNPINSIDISGWEDDRVLTFLKNKEILVEFQGNVYPTVAGAILFAKEPSALLGYSGITITKYGHTERDYDYVDFRLDKPIMNSFSEHDKNERDGLIDLVLEKIKTIILEKSKASLEGAQRVIEYPYPEESIREGIVNAVAHRDYTISGLDIRVDIYPDRLEIESPGRLPNMVSLESIRVGAKYYRNQILVQYLKEAGFMDLHSLGIPIKILKLCTEYTGKEPRLEELENGFKVTIYARKEMPLNKMEEQILNLLESSDKPLKSKEISQYVGMAKRTTLNWINRLIEKNMIEATSSNRNDPDCKYRIRN